MRMSSISIRTRLYYSFTSDTDGRLGGVLTASPLPSPVGGSRGRCIINTVF